MKYRSLLSALLLALALHFSRGFERRGYCTNRFAVKVDGGYGTASMVAKSNGMKNLGLVSLYIYEYFAMSSSLKG